MLTLGHFLFGRPIESLPDPSFSYRPISLLCQWHLCQNIVHQFCQRWRQEYLTSLWRYAKWHEPTRNLSVGVFGRLGRLLGAVGGGTRAPKRPGRCPSQAMAHANLFRGKPYFTPRPGAADARRRPMLCARRSSASGGKTSGCDSAGGLLCAANDAKTHRVRLRGAP